MSEFSKKVNRIRVEQEEIEAYRNSELFELSQRELAAELKFKRLFDIAKILAGRAMLKNIPITKFSTTATRYKEYGYLAKKLNSSSGEYFEVDGKDHYGWVISYENRTETRERDSDRRYSNGYLLSRDGQIGTFRAKYLHANYDIREINLLYDAENMPFRRVEPYPVSYLARNTEFKGFKTSTVDTIEEALANFAVRYSIEARDL